MVIFKLAILLFFIVVAFATAFSTDNLKPFAPNGTDGVVTAAAVIFFAYIGFDAVSTGAEEAQEPKRDLPIAIIGSLVLCTIVYILSRSPRSARSTPRRCRSPTRRSPPCSTRAPGSRGPPA